MHVSTLVACFLILGGLRPSCQKQVVKETLARDQPPEDAGIHPRLERAPPFPETPQRWYKKRRKKELPQPSSSPVIRALWFEESFSYPIWQRCHGAGTRRSTCPSGNTHGPAPLATFKMYFTTLCSNVDAQETHRA
jgi:hypothetical protein